MTLSLGNIVAKVEKDANGAWKIVEGEMSRIFEVEWLDGYQVRKLVMLHDVE